MMNKQALQDLLESKRELYKQAGTSKTMSFPDAEHEQLAQRLAAKKHILTTRVSDESTKYNLGDLVDTKWGQCKIVGSIPLKDAYADHPFQNELTAENKTELEGQPGVLLELEKQAGTPVQAPVPVPSNKLNMAGFYNTLGYVESNNNPAARSEADAQGRYAAGYMQIRPTLVKTLNKWYGKHYTEQDRFDKAKALAMAQLYFAHEGRRLFGSDWNTSTHFSNLLNTWRYGAAGQKTKTDVPYVNKAVDYYNKTYHPATPIQPIVQPAIRPVTKPLVKPVIKAKSNLRSELDDISTQPGVEPIDKIAMNSAALNESECAGLNEQEQIAPRVTTGEARTRKDLLKELMLSKRQEKIAADTSLLPADNHLKPATPTTSATPVKKNWIQKLRNAAYNFSLVSPDSTFQKYAPAIAKLNVRTLQTGLGRVVSNTVNPTGYSLSGHWSQKPGVMDVINAVFADKPSPAVADANMYDRNAQTRYGFGLEPNIPGWNKELRVVAGSGTGKAGDQPVTLEPKWSSPEVQAKYKQALITGDDERMIPGQVWTPWAGNTMVTKGKVTQDPWDIRLHPHEKLNTLANWLRLGISPFINPAKVNIRHPDDVLKPDQAIASLDKKGADTKTSYACLMLDMPPVIKAKINAFAKSIDKEDLAPGHKESELIKEAVSDFLYKTGVDSNQTWIGVDLDGTLAKYHKWIGATNIGKPIPEMVRRVKRWLHNDTQVKILTARVSGDRTSASRKAIERWCLKYLGQSLPVTNAKDRFCKRVYDDRAIRIDKNTGKRIS